MERVLTNREEFWKEETMGKVIWGRKAKGLF